MKFDVDDKNRCCLVCVKFHLNRCRFAVAVAKCFGGSLFCDTVYKSSQLYTLWSTKRSQLFVCNFVKINNKISDKTPVVVI